MATPSQSETRTVSRVLAYTRDTFLPGIVNNAYNHSPLAAMFFGTLIEDMFRDRPMNSRGRRVQTGGESVVQRVRLGSNDTVQDLTDDMDEVNTARQHHVRFARGNWKFGSAAITVSRHDLGTNRGAEALSSMMRDKMSDAVNALVEHEVTNLINNNGVSTAINDLASLVSANDSVHGLSGAAGNHPDWNSRGVSARGTAAASISFASGAFAAQGLADLRRSFNNASEGMIKPMVGVTGWNELEYFEARLQPQQQFQNQNVADSGFTNLMHHTAPVVADSLMTSGEWYWLNFDYIFFVFLSGFDFNVSDFIRVPNQPSQVSQVLVTGELMTTARKFQNKLTGITA